MVSNVLLLRASGIQQQPVRVNRSSIPMRAGDSKSCPTKGICLSYVKVGQAPTMAPGKKKKKQVSNPARGFATTSIASKPRGDASDTFSTTEDPKTVADPSSEANATSNGGTV